MSLELQIRNGSEYRTTFASLAHTLEQIGAPHLGIAMHSSPRRLPSPPSWRAVPPSLSLRRCATPPSPSAGGPRYHPSPSFRPRATPFLLLLVFLEASAPSPPHGRHPFPSSLPAPLLLFLYPVGASGAGEVRGLLVPIRRSSAASVRGRADPRPPVERTPPPCVRASVLHQSAQPLLMGRARWMPGYS